MLPCPHPRENPAPLRPLFGPAPIATGPGRDIPAGIGEVASPIAGPRPAPR
jgi:hypothetical protein